MNGDGPISIRVDLSKVAAEGRELDFGAPTSSELATWGAEYGRPNTAGNRVGYFSRGGSLSAIFFKPGASEAFEVFGAIYNR